ncbi:cobalt ABC transporter ATPase [Desulfosporosinus sp. Tol-M]|nr:cobalt ABC transporter ATPase [Desulfosporosinus sp. Tol-M]
MTYLELSQVSFNYPKQNKQVLKEINLNIKNEVTAIVGANGSGKTTLTKLMLGILQPVNGQIRLEGKSLTEYSLAEVGRRIGYIFQNPDQQFFCPTVFEEIGFSLTHRGYGPEAVRKKVNYYLDYFELSAYKNVYPLHLSQGEKRRLAIAAILVNDPEFLILDEPTVGLDVYRKKLLHEHLLKTVGLGCGMILVSHDIKFVERVAERVVELENGQIRRDRRQKDTIGQEA